MALSAAQRTTLAAHIRASVDANVIAALANRNDTELARLYNLDSAFYVWRSSVQPDEYKAALDWTEVDNLTVGKARIWEWLTEFMTVAYNPANANVRAGLNNAFNSSATTKAALIAISYRLATVAEEIFATGTGTTGTPGDLGWEGTLTIQDVGRALNDNP